MEAHFNSASLKIFNQTLASISRFGDKLFLLPNHDEEGFPEIRLSVLNSSRSGFCSIYFKEDFFESLTCPVGQESIEASINIKALQSIVKNSKTNKNVKTCEIAFVEEGIEDFLSVRLHCKHGVTRTHKLLYEPRDQSVPTGPSDFSNRLSMSPECARNWTDHFLGPKGGEISLWVTPQSCVVRSSEDVPPLVPNKASKDLANRMQISTEVVVPVTDFDDFEIGQETRLTFNLKEFKSLTILTEQFQAPLELAFTMGNEPLHIFLKKESGVYAHAILATHAKDQPPLPAPGVKSERQKTAGNDKSIGAIVPSGNSILNGLKANGSGTSSRDRDRESSSGTSSAAPQARNMNGTSDGLRSASPLDRAAGNSHAQSQPNRAASGSQISSIGSARGNRRESQPLPMESTPRNQNPDARSTTPAGSNSKGPLFFPSASQQAAQEQDFDLDHDNEGMDFDMGDDSFDLDAEAMEGLEAAVARGEVEIRGSQSQVSKDRLSATQSKSQAQVQRKSQLSQEGGKVGIDTNSTRSKEPISSTPRGDLVKQKTSTSDGIQESMAESLPSQEIGPTYDEKRHLQKRTKTAKKAERAARGKPTEEEDDQAEQMGSLAVGGSRNNPPRTSKTRNPMTSKSRTSTRSNRQTVPPTPVSQGGDSLEIGLVDGVESGDEDEVVNQEEEPNQRRYTEGDIPMNSTNFNTDQHPPPPQQFGNLGEGRSYSANLASSSLGREERASDQIQKIKAAENAQFAEHPLMQEETMETDGGIDQEVDAELRDQEFEDELPATQMRNFAADLEDENPVNPKRFKPLF